MVADQQLSALLLYVLFDALIGGVFVPGREIGGFRVGIFK